MLLFSQDHHRRAVSASSVERTKSLGDHSEVRATSAKSACPSDHTFRIQSWLNEKSVRNIQVQKKSLQILNNLLLIVMQFMYAKFREFQFSNTWLSTFDFRFPIRTSLNADDWESIDSQGSWSCRLWYCLLSWQNCGILKTNESEIYGRGSSWI